MKIVVAVLMVVGIVGGGAAYYANHLATDSRVVYRTAEIERGDLVPTITATGTVEPEELVDVGAQVAGRVKSFGIEPSELKGRKLEDISPEELAGLRHIDYCSEVEAGTVLALIDDSVYRAQLDQAEAAVKRAEADLLQLEARCEQAKQEWARAEQLRPMKAIADTDYDLAAANHKVAKANVEVGRAAIDQSRAALELAKANMNYTVIKSPVRGVIIDRRVNVGQTVVGSMNAASMFLIGKDLRRIQIWASVNEGDIGRIHKGMPVRFTVDTFPDEVFYGTVYQVRLYATTTQNVVTYTVIVSTDNSDGRLLPYLTANLQFEVERRENVLKVPNAALRWKPRTEQVAPEWRDRAEEWLAGKTAEREGASDSEASAATAKHKRHEERLWVAEDRYVRPIEVAVGLSDRTMTEVSGADIKPGMSVVVGEVLPQDDDAAADNPFAPKFPRWRGEQKKAQSK
jgi:HlyD family secretion protein